MVHKYTADVRTQLLIELPQEAEQLNLKPGDKIHVQVDSVIEDLLSPQPNEGMLSVLKQIAEGQKSRPYSDSSDTGHLLRAARAGGMWAHDPES